MQRKGKVRMLVKAGLLCAIICVFSQLVVPIGPVPFSLSILAVALTGALLPTVWALASVAAYLLLGLFGLPVFAGFSAGAGVLFGPTGGYLIGYFMLAFFASICAKKTVWLRFMGAALGLLLCYAFGTVWFVAITGTEFVQALWICVIPFVLPDIAKIAVATLAAQAVQKRMQNEG